MEDLALLTKAPRENSGVSVVDLEDLEDVIELLADLTYEERIQKLSLRPDRADVILPAAMVYHRLARIFRADSIRVPHVGVKEGVMFDLVDGLVAHAGYSQRHQREILAGAVALGRRFDFDESHGIHVARLAESLYDQLEPLHQLNGLGREILLAAAVLHDIGQSISYQRHHKHSHYLIAQSELPGFQPEDMALIAVVARYHRKALPSEKHEEFAALDEEDRTMVTQLAAILRIADALDREHQEKVKKATVSIDDDVWLDLKGEGDMALERWAVHHKADLFEKTFDTRIRITGEESEDDDDDDA
jgi:exopolyphosphatase/guanosine-5'-triphosphate,3'-diphosphate pyrophosphatase